MHILIAFDGSPASQRGARFAARIASAMRAQVTLLGLTSPREEPLRSEQVAALAERLASLVEVRTRLGVGRPDRQLRNEVGSDRYDLLVLDGHGSLGLFPPMASTSRIVREVPVPVLVARNAPEELRRILVCTGGDHPVQNFSLAARIAAASGASVEVLHVMSQLPVTGDVPVDGAGLTRSAEWHVSRDTSQGQHLSSFIELFARHQVDAVPRIRHGLIIDQILREAAAYQADLVVLGAHGSTGFLQLLLDDITEHLIDHLERPVLVVRPVQSER